MDFEFALNLVVRFLFAPRANRAAFAPHRIVQEL
jgi:hypothetical protein